MIRTLFILILFIVSTAGLYSQNRMPYNGMPNMGMRGFGKIESNLVENSKDEYTLYLTIRIPFDELIFAKEDSIYTSGLEFSCEVYDGEKLVERKSVTEKVKVSEYNETLDVNKFIQSILTFKLYNSRFIIKPALLRINTSNTFQMHEIELDIKNNEKRVRPVIVSKTSAGNEFELVNRESVIPYDENSYSLLVPLADSLSKTTIKIEQKSVLLKDTLVTAVSKNSFKLIKKGQNLFAELLPKTDNSVSYMKIDLPKTIDEGDLQILLESGKKKILYNLPVTWLDKPFVLTDLDLSVKLLKIITDGKSADFISDQPSEKRYDLLKQEWNKIAKMGQGGLNTLMAEFYKRADFALMNFSYNNQKNGAESDRGKIYIQFGKPTNIERNYNDKNEIIEVWTYDYLKRNFIFEDTSGKGNYILRK